MEEFVHSGIHFVFNIPEETLNISMISLNVQGSQEKQLLAFYFSERLVTDYLPDFPYSP